MRVDLASTDINIVNLHRNGFHRPLLMARAILISICVPVNKQDNPKLWWIFVKFGTGTERS